MVAEELTGNAGPANAYVEAGLAAALNLGTAVLLLIAGVLAARYAQRLVHDRLYALEKFDRTIVPFIGNLARYAILVLTFILVLSEFGVQTTSIIALLGAAGLAVGLALQGTLSNVASGMMLLFLRPFQVGHYIEAGGTSGTVDEIGLFVTSLRTPQNILRVVPNSKIFGGIIANYNAFDRMRVDLEVGISYDAGIARATEVLHNVIAGEPRFLTDPAPRVITRALADSSVNLELRAWVVQDDFFSVRSDLTTAVKNALDAADISIPYPHRQIVMAPGTADTPAAPKAGKTARRAGSKRAA